MKWESEVSARGYWYVLRPRYKSSTSKTLDSYLDSIKQLDQWFTSMHFQFHTWKNFAGLLTRDRTAYPGKCLQHLCSKTCICVISGLTARVPNPISDTGAVACQKLCQTATLLSSSILSMFWKAARAILSRRTIIPVVSFLDCLRFLL